MAVTYGFYNSVDHDRVYDAVQLSSIFDGIIRDGIIQNYRSALAPSHVSGRTLQIAPGRAWFNHTWTLNDADLLLEIDAASSLPRIDSVVLEVNTNTRTNSIKILKGTPASTPSAPTPSSGDGVYQYPLANARINSGSAAINTLTDVRGGTGAPWAVPIMSDPGSLYVRKSGDFMTGSLRVTGANWTTPMADGENVGASLSMAGNPGGGTLLLKANSNGVSAGTDYLQVQAYADAVRFSRRPVGSSDFSSLFSVTPRGLNLPSGVGWGSALPSSGNRTTGDIFFLTST